MQRALLAGVITLVTVGCGDDQSSADPDAARSVDAAGSVDATAQLPDAMICPPESCATNPGAPCRVGRFDCTTGTPVCVDDAAVTNGTPCTDGLCLDGECRASVTIDTDVDLSVDAVSADRTCAESALFAVASLSDTTAVLADTPTDDCVVAGDEVLLINLQGSPGATDNVGNWELLTVADVTGATVDLTTSKTRFYGAASGSDAGIGPGDGDQKVMLVRVPRFGALTVADTATISAARWDGSVGGVIVLRAAVLTVNGTISAATLGYREGRWSQGPALCDDSVATEAGESITGPSTVTTSRNSGGSGGLGAATGASYNSNSPLCSTAAHALPGELGTNGGARTLGEAGAAYGVGDGTRLTMGSGSGGALMCAFGVMEPRLVPGGRRAGGIVLLVADELVVGDAGTVTATATEATRDVAASGGYILLRGGDLSLGDGRVHARGGVARGVNGPTLDVTRDASPGYIVLQTAGTVTGTTDPAAAVVAP